MINEAVSLAYSVPVPYERRYPWHRASREIARPCTWPRRAPGSVTTMSTTGYEMARRWLSVWVRYKDAAD